VLAVKLARLNRNLTQTRFGRMTGLSQHEVSDIELGRIRPTPRQLARMAKALGLDPLAADLLMKNIEDPLRPPVEPTEDEQPEPTTVQ
jgi:transcriptional regulator with XRE-family HTH domain